MCGHVRPPLRHALRAQPDRCPAPRQRAHGAVQLTSRRARAAGASCCASRTPTPSAATTRCSSACSRTCAGSACSGTRVPTSAARTDRIARASAAAIYAEAIATLEAHGRVYPCFCTPEELQLSRKAQLAAGRPPRYAGTCAALSARGGRRGASRPGERPALRFRVPTGRVVEFDDLIHGPQRFATDDIGDFVDPPRRRQRRVLPRQRRGRRGDGHHARAARRRSPRQHAAADPAARGARRCRCRSTGTCRCCSAPSGRAAVEARRRGEPRATCARRATCRARSQLPGAARTCLRGTTAGSRPTRWRAHFDLARSSRSAARFDEAQLRHWQREAVSARRARRADRRGCGHGSMRSATPTRQRGVRRGGARQPAVPGGRRAAGARSSCDAAVDLGREAAAQIAEAGARLLRAGAARRVARARRRLQGAGRARSAPRPAARAPRSSCRCAPR